MLSEVFKSKHSSKQDRSQIAFVTELWKSLSITAAVVHWVTLKDKPIQTQGLRSLDPLSWWEDCQCHCRRAHGMGEVAPATFGKCSLPTYFPCSWLRPHEIIWGTVSLSLYLDSHHHRFVIYKLYHASESPAVLQTHFSGSHPRTSDSLCPGWGRRTRIWISHKFQGDADVTGGPHLDAIVPDHSICSSVLTALSQVNTRGQGESSSFPSIELLFRVIPICIHGWSKEVRGLIKIRRICRLCKSQLASLHLPIWSVKESRVFGQREHHRR